MQDPLSFAGKRWMLAGGRTDDPLIDTLRAARDLPERESPCDAWEMAQTLKDAPKAAQRIRSAITAGEQIGIFGDYDCDGITAVGILMRALRSLGGDPIVRLPHRTQDGYGLKSQHIAEFMKQDITLLITADTGINAHEAIAEAAAQGMDVIVLDHHHVQSLPPAYAILHPAHSAIPLPHPCAAGVAFLFVHHLFGETWDDRVTDLTLAAFGTVADLVPLKGFNRCLVQEGLRAVRLLPPGPVRTFVEHCCDGVNISATDIAFRIAPRINAAGRMGDPAMAFHALLEGGEALQDTERANTQRQADTQRFVAHAIAHIPDPVPPFVVAADSEYAPGIVGLIAGKLTEQYGRPGMAVAIRGSLCTASLRSTPAYHITEGLARIAHLLESFGGHAQAAGCTFALEQLAAITQAMEVDVAARVKAEDLLPMLRLDVELHPHELSANLAAALQALEPFGQGNPEPLFYIPNVTADRLRRVGSDGQHLQLHINDLGCIAFNQGHLAETLSGPVDLAARLQLQTWNGRTRVQLQIVDMRTSMKKEVGIRH